MNNDLNLATHPFVSDFVALSRHYGQSLAEHGDSPAGVQWRDVPTHERRLAILAEVGDVRMAKILDFGCGTGHLLEYLRRDHAFAGSYTGYDLNPEMIRAAQGKFPDAHFEVRDILTSGVPEEFDYVFINGVFNNRISDNWGCLTAVLRTLISHTRVAISFNALSVYVDYFDEGLYYVEPEAVFRFCKEQLSPCVTLRHDYLVKSGVIPFEFTMYVHRSNFAPRQARAAGVANS